jgi:sec-independent protein translocase protein TatC
MTLSVASLQAPLAIVRALPRALRATPPAGAHEQPVVEHLSELRRRLWWCIAWGAVAFVAAYLQRAAIVTALAAPLPADAPDPVTLSVAEPFMTSLRVSAWAALAATMPIATWHGWRFLAPAVDPSLRRSAWIMGVLGVLLATGGAAFGYLVALPQSLAFLVGHDAHLYNVQLRAADLYRFCILVVVASAAVFQLPIILIGLVRFGVVSGAQLRENRRAGWALVAVLAVLMPGVDPILTAVTFVPLLVLWELTCVVAVRLDRRWNAAGS